MKRLLLALFVCVALITHDIAVKAEGFAITDFSARGTGLAGGMVGRADDPSAVAYNPAGITQLPGYQLMMGATLVSPTGRIRTKPAGGGSETITSTVDNLYPAPNIYGTFQLNDSIWLGLGVFSRFGLGIEYPHSWPGRYSLVDVTLQTISFNPNVAFKFTDKLSVAVGFEVMSASMEMNKDTFFGQLGTNRQYLDGDDIAFGANIALHYIINDEWKAGLTYRTKVDAKVKGDSRWQHQGVTIPGAGVTNNSTLHGTLYLPDVLSFGLTYTPSPVWSFEGGFVYTRWSSYKALDIFLDAPSGLPLLSPKDWDDTWLVNISTEYQALDWLALRAGYSYETSPVRAQYADYMCPSGGRHRFNVGAGFSWDNWVLDVAYSYILVRDLDYSESKTSGVAAGTPFVGIKSKDGASQIMGLALTYKF